MARELGGSQISALLESVPGIVNVLRSPVADALVNAIRAAAGLEEFDLASAEELVQYAVRRGLIGASEGDEVLADVRSVLRRGRKRGGAGRKAPARAAARKKAGGKTKAAKDRRKAVKTPGGAKKVAKKTAKKRPAKQATKKKTTKRKTAARKTARSGRAKRR